MDNSKESPAVLSFCSGYGGLEIGLERVFGAVRVLAHVEIEAFAVANLVDKMETGRLVPAPIWTNLKTLPLEPFRGRVDILTGGYPCQPFSAAGKRLGAEDPRHLWPFIRDAVEFIRPGACFFENVDGHVSMGLSSVISDLEEMGYVTTWGVFSAAEVGAPHQRKRVFILAHRSDDNRRSRERKAETGVGADEERRRLSTGGGEELAHRLGARRVDEQQCEERRGASPTDQRGSGEELDDPRPVGQAVGKEQATGPEQPSELVYRWPARPGEDQYDWEEPRVVWNPKADNERGGLLPEDDRQGVSARGSSRSRGAETQPELGRTPDGARDRVDRLRLLGNGVVPQTAEKAFRVLWDKLIKDPS